MTDTPLPAASLWKRLAAMFYDSLLLLALLFLVTGVAVGLEFAMRGFEVVKASQQPAVQSPLLRLALLATVVLFFGGFWRTRQGQTLGMRTWRLRLETLDGDRPGWGQVMLRLGGALVSWLCLGAGFAWILVDRAGLAWHDRWSRTRIVQLPLPAKKT